MIKLLVKIFIIRFLANYFQKNPERILKTKKNNYLIANNYCVIPADATQLGAIQSTENNGSYIIQGPPGTGKSQTIVNLLANEVAKGKSVLFISEKRAALDVVYARMSQIGLKDICTLIHDSQSDKKAFIQDLKYTYELYAKETNQWDDVADKRKEIIKRLQENIDILYKFHSFQKHTKETYSVRQIIDILINTKFDKNAYKDLIYTEAPAISEWLKYRESLNRIEQYLQTNTRFKLISDCPYFYLDAQILNNVNAQTIIAKSDRFEKELSFINGLLETKLAVKLNNFEQINEIISILSKLYILHKDNKTALLDPSSAQTAQFEKSIEEIEQWKSKISQAEEKNKYWIKKPSKDELKRLNKQYKEATGGFLKKLLGKKEEFINTLKKFYDFDSQLVPPEVEEVLSGLNDEYELKLHLQNLKNQFENDSKITKEELNNYRTELDKLINISGHSQLLNNNDLITLLDEMPKISKSYENLTEDKDLLAKHIDVISDLYDHIDELRINTSILYGLAPRLKEWQDLPDVFRQYILNHKLIVNEIEYLSAYKQLLDVSRENGSDINGKELERVVEQIQLLYPKLLKINSTYINEIVKKKFQTALDLDFMPVYEMTNEQKNTKQHYQEGRAILENEFNKKIRYKSIRDLVDEKSGTVIKDLKPVWMMSPLSVSDTLPLTEIFDIVIFDEASQITVEEGIPPLFRASQAIIVGDEMQMPPSNFFSTKLEEDDDEAEFLSMDAESLLNQGVRKLPQVTLGWHYRSRQEALINFSNFAFYEGALYTIPDVYSVDNQQNEIEVYKAKDAIKNTPLIYKNSITYHYLPTGIYDNRMNDDEAEYIAYMVREILMSDTNKSLGIVAFSMQQQSNIENALNRLANDDTKFAIVLEEAFSGNNEEEFTGLFVKNLENVQGDERDIMILSICYGYNPKGKMLMNFGPINRRGGEKRLNVIFSRAKYHMVIVSSIKHNDITNEYNEGANYLKKYLQYSQYVSAGKFDAAQSILHNLGRRKQIKDKAKETLWIDEIKQFLEEKGYFVKLNLGQSRLKIDLGIKKEKTQKLYDLGIIIDHIESYQSNDVLSQYYTIPQILNVFGWQVYKIFANDWLNHKDSILQNIIDVLENKIIKPEANDIIAIEANEEKIEEEISEISDGKIVELINLSKNKFWTIKQNNNKINIVIGSIGETGFSSDYNFDNISAADEYFENQIISRKSRGFKEKE
jgi:superfamily I DNA and/or RNA helicase/predicted DNA-binding WGR domain protein